MRMSKESSRYILTLRETNEQLELKLSVSNDQYWVWDSRLLDTRERAKVSVRKGVLNGIRNWRTKQ